LKEWAINTSDIIAAETQQAAGRLAEIRHEIHRHPEVGLDLPATQAVVLRELNDLGLEVTTGKALSSVTAVLRGGSGRRQAVLLRADMDALPLQEDTPLSWASVEPGRMHACGHDLHTAMLLGAATALSKVREDLDGDVVFMFQPGEEGWDGAGHMLAEGILDAPGYRVSTAYALHVVAGQYPFKSFVSRPGTFMAASDRVEVIIEGAGGHGSRPHFAKDPVSVATELVSGLYTLINRRFGIADPAVLTVGLIEGGTKRNIIPDTARFEGTIRTFSAGARQRVQGEIERFCMAMGNAYDVNVKVDYETEYPATVNDADLTSFAADVVRDVYGDGAYVELEYPEPAAEDFSRVLELVRGTYLFIGASDGDEVAAANNHSSKVQFSDEVLAMGARMYAELAVRTLQSSAASAN
jgi:hippurate hydrolase